jgi:chromosome segregation ATPase
MKPLVIILSLVCVALAAQLILRFGRSGSIEKELAVAGSRLYALSNEVAESRSKAWEEARLATYLQSNLTQRVADLTAASNALSQASASLATAQEELKAAQDEAKKQTSRVSELEGQKDDLQGKLDELAGSIKSLNEQIAETKRKLSASEGDRDSLTKELAKLQTDKAELLKQFNDLAALRAQVALLKEEAAVNQRLSWMAQGVYQAAGRKGAEALVSKPTSAAAPSTPSLNVEIQQNGGATVVPPTRTPAQK